MKKNESIDRQARMFSQNRDRISILNYFYTWFLLCELENVYFYANSWTIFTFLSSFTSTLHTQSSCRAKIIDDWWVFHLNIRRQIFIKHSTRSFFCCFAREYKQNDDDVTNANERCDDEKKMKNKIENIVSESFYFHACFTTIALWIDDEFHHLGKRVVWEELNSLSIFCTFSSAFESIIYTMPFIVSPILYLN